MNTLLEILTYLVFSAIIFSIIWYIVVLLIRRFLFYNEKPTNKSIVLIILILSALGFILFYFMARWRNW